MFPPGLQWPHDKAEEAQMLRAALKASTQGTARFEKVRAGAEAVMMKRFGTGWREQAERNLEYSRLKHAARRGLTGADGAG